MQSGWPPKNSQASHAGKTRSLRWKRTALLTLALALGGGAGTFHLWGNRPLGHAVRAWSQPRLADLRHAEHYDVLVTGATPSGLAAAVGAARRGASVLLVEQRAHVGGDITYAMLNMFDVPMAPRGQNCPVAYGVFGELYKELGTAFDLKRAETAMLKIIGAEPNITLRTSTAVTRLYLSGSQLAGVKLRDGAGTESTVSCAAAVDATNDADIAAQAGAGYYLGRENANPDKRMQAAGLLFAVRDVNWRKVRAYVRGSRIVPLADLRGKKGLKNSIDARSLTASSPPPSAARAVKRNGTPDGPRNGALTEAQRLLQTGPGAGPAVVLRHGGMVGNYAWERGDVVKDYKPRGPHIMVLSINFGRQDDGTVVLNTINIVGVNGLNHASRLAAYQEASHEIPLLVEYLRHRMPGFENARLARIAPELYIRETRHIHGYYSLKARDVSQQARFDDRVALCSYPLDLHPYKLNDVNPFGPRRYYYTIPLRSLVPRRVDGIFVASRSLSATYSAAGSARVIPPTMAAGEAAGAAAALCWREGITPHQMMDNSRWVRQLQDELRETLFDVGDEYPPYAAPDATRSTLVKGTGAKNLPPAGGARPHGTPSSRPISVASERTPA